MTRRVLVAVMLAALTIVPRASGAAVPLPDAETAGVSDAACIRPVVPTGASCTFNLWGHVRDPEGVVQGASVGDGARRTTSDERGFFDLYLPAPGSYMVWVESRPGCRTLLRVDVDPIDAVRDGGVRREIALPCTRPTYNAFGFAVVQHGALITVARSGVTHSGGAPGRLDWHEFRGGARARPKPFVDTLHDDRDAAGGLTRSGALVVFFAHFDQAANRWAGMRYVRAARDGSVSGEIRTGRLESFSPYGPIVILPSGRLMQTFYGTDGTAHRIYTSFSNDDGRTWSSITPIDASAPFRANEAAAAYLDGRTDATSRIVMVARADGYRGRTRWFGLVQYTSADGGRSWRRQGLISMTSSRRESIPWVASLERGRIALVWADRGTLTLKRSITSFADAVAMRWRTGDVVYRSNVRSSLHPNIGDFGYPSVASFGPQDSRKTIVFNDVNPAGSVGYAVDVDLYAVPLWASPSDRPVTLSP